MDFDRLSADHPRVVLDRLARERGDDYASLSRLLRRNPAYVQQFIKRGSPRRLDERDRATLARYFGVDEAVLGGDGAPSEGVSGAFFGVPRLDIGASAGAGALAGDEVRVGAVGFDPAWLRREGLAPDRLSVVRVTGDSMEPTLFDGDEIMVDTGDRDERLRDGIYVIRIDDVVKVKRLSRAPGRGRVSVVSDNAAYPRFDDVALEDVGIVGRVVWAGRRLG